VIEDQLEVQPIVVVHGAPGLGKSRLAKEYAHQHAEVYPGGMFFIPFDQPPPIELAKLLRDTDRPAYPDESVEDQCRRALHALGNTGRALVIYDAVADEPTLRDWLPSEGLDWHLIATSTSARWASTWSILELEPLQSDAARELTASILGDETAANRLAEAIATNAAGITIELCASAAAARERLRRGRTVEGVSAELAKETTSSFKSAWTLLSPEAQLVLQVASTFVTLRVPASLIVTALQGIGWDARRVEDAIDNARDRKLAGGDNDNLDVHQLVARFVRAQASFDVSVRRALFDGLLSTARAFSEHPGDLDRRALMLTHSLGVDEWAALVTNASEWDVVGDAITELGQFAKALPWFERAVAAKAKGDVHGRVNSESLGTSLRQVGVCYSRQGQFAEALPWFERAVAAKEEGGVHDRVDSANLGTTLHEVGDCYSHQGKFVEALPWFERAVAAKEKGDMHGRVDSASLGTSLHQAGFCYERQGKFAEALPWFERAVVAKEKGDVHVRVDPASLGKSLHQVGYCYSRQGKFVEALPWFDLAIVAKEQGDVHSRVDAASLGTTLHQVGYCYERLCKFAEALLWFERAVAAAEKGDVHGRVDPASLGTTLHKVGVCYSRQGKFAEALPWFERAVAAKEKGDVHGRVDPTSLGKSLHQVGDCYASQRKFAEALPWFERAVAAKEQGNMHGRVDPVSLGASLRCVGDCYTSLGKPGEAQPWFERALMVLKREPDP